MRPRASSSRTAKLISGILTVAILLIVCTAPVLAQGSTPELPTISVVVTATPTVPSPTPTVSPTPTLTPTPTPTYTALQARLVLAQSYLNGGDFTKAAEIFSAVALEDRGNAEALAGLDAALKGQTSATATAALAAAAPPPTVDATAVPAATAPAFAGAFADRAIEFGAAALAFLAAVLLLYLLAKALRWLLGGLREIWFNRIRRPPVGPGLLIGELADATGEEGSRASKGAAQALTEQLVAWNAAVQAKLRSPVQADGLDRPGLAWLRALWDQVFPARRAYRITGVVSGKQPGPYRISLNRTDLRSNKVDASRTFESNAETPEQAFRELGMTAAFWARDPLGMEGAPGMLEMPARAPGLTGAARGEVQPTPTQIAVEALKRMGQVRAQVKLVSVDYPSAPHTLEEAQSLIEGLPAASKLRADLQSAIDDLWRQVQPGRVGR